MDNLPVNLHLVGRHTPQLRILVEIHTIQAEVRVWIERVAPFAVRGDRREIITLHRDSIIDRALDLGDARACFLSSRRC